MPTVTINQSAAAPSPVAHLVTQDGRAVPLVYTPRRAEYTPPAVTFATIDRQGRDPLTRPAGRRPAGLRFTHTVYDQGRTVDGQIARLVGLADEGVPVRLINVSGMETGWWIIDDLQVDVRARTEQQQTAQARLTWELAPYTPVPVMDRKPARPPAAPTKPSTGTGPSQRTYTIKPGDTLWAIAARFLGSGREYPAIAAANDIANPNLIFPGTILTIPAG